MDMNLEQLEEVRRLLLTAIGKIDDMLQNEELNVDEKYLKSKRSSIVLCIPYKNALAKGLDRIRDQIQQECIYVDKLKKKVRDE